MLVAQKVHHILGYIKSSIDNCSRKMISPFYSTLAKPHLESCIQLWVPQHKDDTELLE